MTSYNCVKLCELQMHYNFNNVARYTACIDDIFCVVATFNLLVAIYS